MKQPDVILFDDPIRNQLLPLTYTKPAACLRTGIFTNQERWERQLGRPVFHLTEPYLTPKFGSVQTESALYVNGRYLATREFVDDMLRISAGSASFHGDILVAFHTNESFDTYTQLLEAAQQANNIKTAGDAIHISRPWQLFSLCDLMIRNDYAQVSAGRNSHTWSSTNTVLGDNLFVEEGVSMEAVTINTQSGPVYIGKGAEIMEGAVIRGPFSLGDHSTVKMGSKIYGATAIGPHCKVGGEINNSVISGYSNKAHDGFLGNSVIGEWCNLGADTNNSNLKNNYAEVRLYDYVSERFVPTGLQFCGLIMGDHSKCGINTMFNTGTVVGVNANIFGDGFPRNFIPSFSWGGAAGFSTYKLTDALKVAEVVMNRRDIPLTKEDMDILTYIFEQTQNKRTKE